MALLTTIRRISNPMCRRQREPTISEILSDTIVVALMKADGVDPIALEAQLRGIAQSSGCPKA